MLREATMTSGIGVRTAHNILCTPTKDALIDRILTSVTNAKQKKKTKSAQHKDPTPTFVLWTSMNVCKKLFVTNHAVANSILIQKPLQPSSCSCLRQLESMLQAPRSSPLLRVFSLSNPYECRMDVCMTCRFGTEKYPQTAS